MLTKINYITGTGLFESMGASPDLTKATLVFGENGRGKSTLAALLRSANDNEAAPISARRTLGNAIEQTASFDIQRNSGVETITLANEAWSNQWEELLVFDAEFVSKNVYAGHGVSPDQRAGLLSFAVGEAAVQTKKDLDSLTIQASAAGATFRERDAALTQARGQYSVKQYRALPADPDSQTKIDALRQKAAQAKDLAAVKATPGAQLIPQPKLDLEALFAIFRKSVVDISEAAALKVKDHITSRAASGFEGWLAAGSKYIVDEHCPFCGVVNGEETLLSAYHSYFNHEYHALKEQSSSLPASVETRLGGHIAEVVQSNVQKAQAQLSYWRNSIELPPTEFDSSQYGDLLAQLRNALLPLAHLKSGEPLSTLGSQAELDQATAIWSQLVAQLNAFNEILIECNRIIDAHKTSLEAAQPLQIELEIKRIEIQRDRHSAAAAALLSDYDVADQARSDLTKQKEAARVALNDQMEAIFKTYGESINGLLASFGAQIEIHSLKPTFRGQSAIGRTEYELVVRGSPISLTATDGAHFGNTLSEGDKRALAYAFFLAKVMNSADLATKTIVIDDPVCSLDWNRRAATIRSLLRLAKACRQLIVLAHDAYFIRALGEGLSKVPETKNKVTYLKVSATSGNASLLTPFDVDEECKGRHRRNIDALASYLANPATGSAQLASKAIRPVLEGYLRNRFPLSPPTGNMLGSVIAFIQSTDESSPYFTLKPFVTDFNDINDYTIQFMHEDGAPEPPLVEAELRTYCQRVLTLINR